VHLSIDLAQSAGGATWALSTRGVHGNGNSHSHGNGSTFGLLMGMEMGIVLTGMGIAYFIGEKLNSHPYSLICRDTKCGTFRLKYVTQPFLIYFL